MKTRMRLWSAWLRLRRRVRLWVDVHVHKYHLLDLRHPGGYKGGWVDRSEVIYLAAFRALRDFVEEEMTDYGGAVGEGGVVAWDAGIKAEILDLYWWWVRGRAVEHDAMNKEGQDLEARVGKSFDFEPAKDFPEGYSQMVTNPNPLWSAYFQRYDALNTKDDDQFERLMAIRKYLWT